jgi:hypothetical protein
MPRIEIGAGVLLAIAATFGFFDSAWSYLLLSALGSYLIIHGSYDEWIKPRFRVDQRIADWLLRRAWNVQMERRPSFNWMLRVKSGSSGYEIQITRQKNTLDDLIGFTGLVPRPDDGTEEILEEFSEPERRYLIAAMRMTIAHARLGFEFVKHPDTQKMFWPPSVIVQGAIPQDHTLSQHSVDQTAKNVESAIIEVRDVIRIAALRHISSSKVRDGTDEAPPAHLAVHD